MKWLRLVGMLYCGAGILSAALWACSDPDRPPLLLNPDGKGIPGPSDASKVPDANPGSGCVLTLSGAREGTYTCTVQSLYQVVQGGQVWLSETSVIRPADPQDASVRAKVGGVRCLTNKFPDAGTLTCECGYGELTQDGGQVGQWVHKPTAPAEMRIDSLTALTPNAAEVEAGVTPYRIHGTGRCDAEDVLDSGAPPIRIESTF